MLTFAAGLTVCQELEKFNEFFMEKEEDLVMLDKRLQDRLEEVWASPDAHLRTTKQRQPSTTAPGPARVTTPPPTEHHLCPPRLPHGAFAVRC